jgi:hypothetical protein
MAVTPFTTTGDAMLPATVSSGRLDSDATGVVSVIASFVPAGIVTSRTTGTGGAAGAGATGAGATARLLSPPFAGRGAVLAEEDAAGGAPVSTVPSVAGGALAPGEHPATSAVTIHRST